MNMPNGDVDPDNGVDSWSNLGFYFSPKHGEDALQNVKHDYISYYDHFEYETDSLESTLQYNFLLPVYAV